jgi:hypothetical protein
LIFKGTPCIGYELYFQYFLLTSILGWSLHDGYQLTLLHCGDALINHLTLPEQRVCTSFYCVGLEVPVITHQDQGRRDILFTLFAGLNATLFHAAGVFQCLELGQRLD